MRTKHWYHFTIYLRSSVERWISEHYDADAALRYARKCSPGAVAVEVRAGQSMHGTVVKTWGNAFVGVGRASA